MPYEQKHMEEAIALAAENIRSGLGGPFGAVITCQGKVVARASNRVTSNVDPTAHAEIQAIREACRKLGQWSLEECELYSSCEPCPMCMSAIYWARIPVVYYSSSREDAARIGFDDKLIYEELEKPPSARSIAIEEKRLPASGAVFEQWQQLEQKQMY